MEPSSLFPTLLELEPSPAPGPFAAVALEESLDKLLDYAIGPKLRGLLRVGQRVRVPLGRNNRPAFGYVIEIRPTSAFPKIKNVLSIDDERVLITPALMELARWMSRYYCAPLGTVLESVIPSAVRKNIGLQYVQLVHLAKPRSEIQAILEKTKARKRRAILARLLQVEEGSSIELPRLASEAGTTLPTVRTLARLGLIRIQAQIASGEVAPAEFTPEESLALNDDQRRVFDDIEPRISAGGFSVNLLHGVTGSGKTEIYLQCIRQIVAKGLQAIVLVPEIALTPQTVRRFTARFGRVAVLHSGQSAGQRHRFWQQIASGGADVAVGARSAIFAPLARLGMIVVDEEHEASYKQDTAPRYHARDVAIKLAQLQNIPILLGSATPSLETFWRVRSAARDAATPGSSRYHLLNLPNRVRNLALPKVELIDMKQERQFHRGIHLISRRLEALLHQTLDAKQQAILLLNRRGYSNFVYCVSCQEPLKCRYCDTTLTYHRSADAHAHNATTAEGMHTGQLYCHYCLAVAPLSPLCPQCGKKLSLFGLGTQRVEEELARKFPAMNFARVDSDSMRSGRDYEMLLDRFGRGQIQVMLGTQMIAKGLDYPNVTLVGVISGDTALALPDFRAAERTFQLITQVAGRAGRGDVPGRVVLQTYLPDDPIFRYAIQQDYLSFASAELARRSEVALPPFTRMVRIVLRDQDLEKLQKHAEELSAAFSSAIAGDPATRQMVTLKGPMPCAIGRVAGYYRFQIVLSATRPEALQRVLLAVRESGGLARSDRIAVDVDPVALL